MGAKFYNLQLGYLKELSPNLLRTTLGTLTLFLLPNLRVLLSTFVNMSSLRQYLVLVERLPHLPFLMRRVCKQHFCLKTLGTWNFHEDLNRSAFFNFFCFFSMVHKKGLRKRCAISKYDRVIPFRWKSICMKIRSAFFNLFLFFSMVYYKRSRKEVRYIDSK